MTALPNTPIAEPRRISTPTLHVLPVSHLLHLDRGWTRGHATASFPDLPVSAAGYLTFPPVLLAAVQEIDGGAGYPMHHHEGIETITVMLSGTLAHDDSCGGRGFTGAEDVAVLSAGSGIDHEEMALCGEPVRAVMFWVRSQAPDAAPRFAKRTFPREDRRDRLVTVASGRSPSARSLPICADVSLRTGVLSAGAAVTHVLAPGRRAYLVSTFGGIVVNGVAIDGGDRVLVSGAGRISIRAIDPTELVLLDV